MRVQVLCLYLNKNYLLKSYLIHKGNGLVFYITKKKIVESCVFGDMLKLDEFICCVTSESDSTVHLQCMGLFFKRENASFSSLKAAALETFLRLSNAIS